MNTLRQLFTLSLLAIRSYGIRFRQQQQVRPFFNRVSRDLSSQSEIYSVSHMVEIDFYRPVYCYITL